MESGQWARWSWLTWIQYCVPFSYYWLLIVVACGGARYPKLLLAVQETRGLSNLGRDPMHR